MHPASPGTGGDAGRDARVLVCAEDATAARTMRAALEAAGYAVAMASRREDADALIESDAPHFAIVDISSRGVDAQRLAARLAAARIAFALVSTEDDAALVRRAIDTGAMACFTKPLHVAALVPSIAVWMARAAELQRLRDLERSMRDALQTNRAVGTAVGILMARLDVDAESAFETLRRQARDERLDVRRLAARLVEGRDRPA